MTYTEELMAADPSHPSVVTVRTGVTRDGRMVARHLRAIHSTGAYGAMKPTPGIGIGGANHGGGPYNIEHTLFEAIQVYTNNAPSGFYRAPGATQAVFAAESHTDLVAKELGMDPAQFRFLNMLGEGDISPLGEQMHDVRASETLQAALDAIGWDTPKPGPNRGRGIAMYDRHVGAGMAGATLRAEPDGTLVVVSPTFDQGVGTHTVLHQMVAQDMGLPLDQVRVTIGDTDTAPLDGGVGGARVTNSAGHAFLKAAAELRERLLAQAAQTLECPQEAIRYDAGQFWCENNPNETLSLGEVVAATGGPVTVTTNLNVQPAHGITCFTAQVADVEVDPETGQVRIHRFVTAHDVGTIINPVTHQGQIDGGVSQGIGVALMEQIITEDGQVMNLNLGDYKLPTMADMPDLETVLVHAAGGPAPYEAKSIGEMANPSPPAAIANAIDDAVGVRIFDLPITAEKIYRKLRERE
jgi:carbon-monoxide dehydrogenase large subunit